jgi:small subunit ribosomal protein S9
MENNKMSKSNLEKDQYFTAVGRRKEAIAKIRLLAGNGLMEVNGKSIDEYFSTPVFKKLYMHPFEISNSLGKYTISVKVSGGGRKSQLDAVIHGITRALVKADNGLKPSLKKEGLLTRDPRVKERRKYGHAHKARAMKQSPKR